MADRGRSPRSRTRSQAPWDSGNPANWTAGKLKSELEKMNITLPISLGKNMLQRIYLENVARRHRVSELRPNMSDGSNEQIEPVLQELNERHSNNDIMEASNVVQAESEIPSAIASTNNNSPGSDTVTHAPCMNTGNNMADKTIIVSMLNSMQTMQQTMMGLQQTVLKLASEKSQNKEDNSLTSAYAAMSTSNHDQHSDNLVPTSANTNGGYRFPKSEFGIPSECIPHIDVVLDNIK